LFLSFLLVLCNANGTPEQIHLALTDIPNEMAVSWLTPDDVTSPTIQYGLEASQLTFFANASSTYYVYPPDFYVSGSIHHGVCSNLKPNTIYYYRVGSTDGGWSSVYQFNTSRILPISFICTGDIGHSPDSQRVVNDMLATTQKRKIDFLYHAGDMSYANFEQGIWDTWFNMIQPLATKLPYMVAVGNHELFSLFVAYDTRFNMPGDESGSHEDTYFSFDYQNMHIISLSSEQLVYYHWLDQYIWLEADLAKVDRSKTPWVILSWHSPWYTSSTVHTTDGDAMRLSFEDLIYKYKVDLVLVGHVHAYERTYSVYNGTVTDDGPIYLCNGNGGNGEGLYNTWVTPQPAWSAHREAYFGYGVITVYNSTHIYWEAKSVDDGKIHDQFWFVRYH